jgi:hypothetical protein
MSARHGQSVASTVCSHRGRARLGSERLGDEVNGTPISTTLATHRYTHTSTTMAGEVLSLGSERLGYDARRRSGRMAPIRTETPELGSLAPQLCHEH